MLWKGGTQYASKICKAQQWPQDWKRSVFIPIPKKGNAKECSNYAQLHSFHTLAKKCSKFSKPGFRNMWAENFQMFKLDLEKVKEPQVKLPTSVGSKKRQENSKNKKIYFCFIDYTKAFDYVDHNKLENSSRDRNTRPPYLPSEKPVCRLRSNS